MDTADVVIIGAGFAGASTAYHLVSRGVRDVIVVEHEARAGLHASGRNAALAFQVLEDPVEAALALEGARFMENPPSGFTSKPLLRRSGSLLVAGQDGMSGLRRSFDTATQLGIGGAMLTSAEAVERVPLLRAAPPAGAFWNPHDGVVDIQELLRGFLDGAQRMGARIVYGRSVTGLRVAHHRMEAVETSAGPLHTRLVVNAAGAWAGAVGAFAGIGTRTLVPRRRHMFRVRSAAPIPGDAPFVWHNDVDVYFRPEGDELIMSPCDAIPHPVRAPEVDGSMEQVLVDKVARAFPALAPMRVTSAWACLRTFACDERFVIGVDPEVHGLVWVAALGGHGMTTSPAVGRLGAAAVLNDAVDALNYLSPARLVG